MNRDITQLLFETNLRAVPYRPMCWVIGWLGAHHHHHYMRVKEYTAMSIFLYFPRYQTPFFPRSPLLFFPYHNFYDHPRKFFVTISRHVFSWVNPHYNPKSHVSGPRCNKSTHISVL